MSIHSFSIYDMFKRNARLFKNDTAIVYDDERITFGDLLKQIGSLSGSLSKQGLGKGDRIAVLAQNSSDYFLIYGAAASLGAIVVPINWRLSVEEIQHILLDSSPNTLFFDVNYKPIVSQLRPSCQSLEKFFILGESEGDYISFKTLQGNHTSVEAEVKGDDPYVIIYTAAVRGKPMGAVLSHNNFTPCNVQAIAMMRLTADEAYLNILPLFHIAGLSIAFSVMHAGGTNVVIPGFDPRLVLEVIQKEKVSIIGSFPPILTELLSEMANSIYDLSSLKHVLGLENPDIIAQFEKKTGAQFWLVYGQTETTGLTCLCINSEKPGSSGRQGLLVDIKIVDEYDRDVRPAVKGEILVRGPLVFKGYLQQDAATSYAFRGGWHHTGDLGRLDEEGYLWFLGRKSEKDLIKSGGENVYPAEVEKVILEHPAVKEVAVFGVPDHKFGEGIKAVCVLKPNVEISEKELIDFVADRMARYKKPRYVSFVNSLLKKENGEIDRERIIRDHGQRSE